MDIGYESRVAQIVAEQARFVNLTGNIHVKFVVQEDVFQLVKSSLGMDLRSKVQPEDEFASVFQGLDFDPERIRTQVVAVFHKTMPVALTTFIIYPRKYIDSKKYLYRRKNGVVIWDFSSLIGGEIADFVICLGYTKVKREYSTQLAVIGFRAIARIMQLLRETSPDGTWVEMVAQGTVPISLYYNIYELTRLRKEAFIPATKLPFKLENIGENYPGSTASVKAARLLGLKRIPEVGAIPSLGPVFLAKAEW